MSAPILTKTERQALGHLNLATDWIVRWGRYVMARKGYAFLEAKVEAETGTHLWSEPVLDTEEAIALFRLRAGGYFYRVETIHTQEIAGVSYEYWAVQVSAQLNVPPVSACLFYVTAARNDPDFGVFGAQRDILASDSRFIREYQTETGHFYRLPLSDLRVLFGLHAWEYPSCFPGSDLPKTEVVAQPDGGFSARRVE